MPALSALSLFAGCGGLDHGAHQAGFRIKYANEIDETAAEISERASAQYGHGLPDPGVDTRDVLDVLADPDKVLEIASLDRGESDVLIGGPPCTPFSKSGFWLEWKREGLDPDATLLQAYTALLDHTAPRAFVMENVYALTFNNKASRPHLDRFLAEASCAAEQWGGYSITRAVLNAADYGAPQARPRLFVVGIRKDQKLDPRLPEPTHFGTWERSTTGNQDGLPHVTAGDALTGLMTEPEAGEEVRGRWGHLLPEVPEGENYLHFTAERGHPDPIFEWRSRYWSFLLKLSKSKPSPTIQAQPGPNVGPFHWDNRRLRSAELKRLFGYPDDYPTPAKRADFQRLLGNSVPPPLARAVISQVADLLS